ncbi:MAG: hypothetical protein HKN79_05365 [Flavobacteriales bacterium]|nr:hypothetical protein [Flavobacteriales bacterium]
MNPEYANEGLPAWAIILYLAVIIFLIAAQWKIYQKAGQPGWAAIIPIYNIYILTKIVGKPGWWVLMMFIPFVNLIFAIWMTNLLSKSFGQGVGFTIGLLLLGIVFYPMLGFGDYKYHGPAGADGAPATVGNDVLDA